MPSENAENKPIRITFAKGTDVGRQRGHNEDYLDAFTPPDPAQRRQKGQLFIIADGMGGHQAGEVASKSAVQMISHEYYTDPDPNVAAALVRSIQKANALIHQQAQESLSRVGMGTTVVAAVARGNELLLANVGDSRAYLLRNGSLRQVTRDHSFVEEQIRAGILSREEARTHPQRNVITRALGSKSSVEVDTYSGTLTSGDTLLLCSDGLSESVHEQDLTQMLQQYTPHEAVRRLIALANERGGSDNISAIVAQVEPSERVVATRETVPVAPTTESPARRRLSRRVIFGLGGGAVLLVAATAAGLLFLAPSLGWGEAGPTPTETPQPTTAVPTPSPTVASQDAAAPTATPRVGFSFLEPPDGAVLAPGTPVNFQWTALGGLPEPHEFVVKTNHPSYQELCRLDEGSCVAPLGPGEYEWWVEIRSGNRLISASPRRKLLIKDQPTAKPPPVATGTSAPSPLRTPEATGGG